MCPDHCRGLLPAQECEEGARGLPVDQQHRLLLDRLQFQAALGLNHSDDGVEDSTIASAIAGLRYTF